MSESSDDLGQRVARLEEQMKETLSKNWALKAIIILLAAMLLTGSGTLSLAKALELFLGK